MRFRSITSFIFFFRLDCSCDRPDDESSFSSCQTSQHRGDDISSRKNPWSPIRSSLFACDLSIACLQACHPFLFCISCYHSESHSPYHTDRDCHSYLDDDRKTFLSDYRSGCVLNCDFFGNYLAKMKKTRRMNGCRVSCHIFCHFCHIFGKNDPDFQPYQTFFWGLVFIFQGFQTSLHTSLMIIFCLIDQCFSSEQQVFIRICGHWASFDQMEGLFGHYSSWIDHYQTVNDIGYCYFFGSCQIFRDFFERILVDCSSVSQHASSCLQNYIHRTLQ